MLSKPRILSLFPTRFINSTNHEHSCEILFVCCSGNWHFNGNNLLFENMCFVLFKRMCANLSDYGTYRANEAE